MLTIDTARSWYPQDDPVHGFDHILRVYRLAECIARAEGADLEIVRAAVLLHDSTQHSNFDRRQAGGKEAADLNGKPRENHQYTSAEFARQVLEGEGFFTGGEHEIPARTGSLLICKVSDPHGIRATSRMRVLVTIAPPI